LELRSRDLKRGELVRRKGLIAEHSVLVLVVGAVVLEDRAMLVLFDLACRIPFVINFEVPGGKIPGVEFVPRVSFHRRR
jgi:hypothetical protein